jgi:phosphate transport system substrate-binding protein
MFNLDGKTVSPDGAAFQAAAANANWGASDHYYVILTNQPGPATWPIAGATFILMHKQPADAAASLEALKFFAWAYAKGGKMAEDLDYVPLPAQVTDQIKPDQEDVGHGIQKRRGQATVHRMSNLAEDGSPSGGLYLSAG